MPAIVLWIGSMLMAFLRVVGPQILLTLGLSLVTEKFVGNVVLPNVASYFTGLPDYALQTMGAMNADRCFSILISAIAVRTAARGLSRSRVRLRRRGVVSS
jgi:hypothetical protein